MKIKICGITSQKDAMMAVTMGADLLGFNFYPKSPRYITPQDAATIIKSLPKRIVSVGIFVDETLLTINAIQQKTHINLIQLHGNESLQYCKALSKPLIKAIRPKIQDDLNAIDQFATLGTILIDAPQIDGRFGGTGHLASWSLAESIARTHPIILAGGLNESNIKEAIAAVKPHMVDVCSGIEEMVGKKSKLKMQAFFDAIYDRSLS